MSDIDKRIARLQRRFQEATNTLASYGILGTADGAISDRSKPGNVWGREWAGNGQYSLPRSYLNALPDGTKIWAGMPVRFGFVDGQQAVVAKDFRNGEAPAQLPTQFVSQQSITALLVQPTDPVSMSVQVLGYSFVISDVTYDAPTTDGGVIPHIDLTSVEAGLAADEHCYATVYLLADFSGYEMFSSTGKSQLYSLENADIDECHALKTAGSKALRAIRVYEGMTSVTSNDVYVLPSKDLRPFFWLG